MPKKTPQNAFYFFMQDYKREAQERGERFPGGLRDVAELAGPDWSNLSAEDRKYYEDLAKAEKMKRKGDTSGNLTNMHRTFEEVDRKQKEEANQKSKMDCDINGMIASLRTPKLLQEFKFYLIHCNYFCVTEGECYHPAELAVSEFCLAEGVTNVYHTIIQPSQIPLGYRFDAQENSEKTHRIPIEDNDGQTDFYKILCDINKFLEPARRANVGENPPMFTMPDNQMLNHSISAVKSVMTNLCYSDPHNARYDVEEKYRIYPLEKLYYQLQLACSVYSAGKNTCMLSMALHELETDVFNYTQSIGCLFHQEQDIVEFCSASYVQRWAFSICDRCCPDIGIKKIPGKHVPKNTDVEFNTNKALEEEKPPPPPKTKPYTWKEPAKNQEPWAPRELPQLRKPTKQANLDVLLPKLSLEPEHASLDRSEENFPSISVPVGRGRGRHLPQGGGRGSLSFAQATKRN